MARRSDHSRAQLEALIISAGYAQMAEKGFVRFSAREVAKAIGYTIGTIYNVMDSHDHLILAINGHTFTLWADFMRARLAAAGEDRIAALVEGYFDFASSHKNVWMAIYDHRMPAGEPMPEWYTRQRISLTSLIEAEVLRGLPASAHPHVPALTRSLVATVHGHAFFALNGTFEILGETAPRAAALARVRETLTVAARASGDMS